MSNKKKRGSKGRRPERRYSILTNQLRKNASENFNARREWPIAASFVPDPDVWKVSGCGTAAVIRRTPDGQFASAMFVMELMQGGIITMCGKSDHPDLDDATSFVDAIQDHSPPAVAGDAELAARYIYGAYAFGLEQGYDFPVEERRPYLSLVPALAGTRNWWLQQLSHDGLTPQRLIDVLFSIDVPDDLPEGKEIVCFTTATLDLAGDPEQAMKRLEKRDPEFAYAGDDKGDEVFNFTRKYPRNHWSPLASLGGRQILGDVAIAPGTLRASSKALSMAARLVTRLKEILGDSIRLRETEWTTVQEMLELRGPR